MQVCFQFMLGVVILVGPVIQIQFDINRQFVPEFQPQLMIMWLGVVHELVNNSVVFIQGDEDRSISLGCLPCAKSKLSFNCR